MIGGGVFQVRFSGSAFDQSKCTADAFTRGVNGWILSHDQVDFFVPSVHDANYLQHNNSAKEEGNDIEKYNL